MNTSIDCEQFDSSFIKQHKVTLDFIENYLVMLSLRGIKYEVRTFSGKNYKGIFYDIDVNCYNIENVNLARGFSIRIFRKVFVTKAKFFINIPIQEGFSPRKVMGTLRKAGISSWGKQKTKNHHCYEIYLYDSSSQIVDIMPIFSPYMP